MRVCKCCGRELPEDKFPKLNFGVALTCYDCISQHKKDARARKKAAEEAISKLKENRQLQLSEFKPRELIDELKRRGYEGTLTYTEIHSIKL